jgi:N6-L-threonylcarbamoyladenine synthase
MKILAIETSCDETAASVISNGKIKSSIIASQAKMHNQFGGVVPEVAAREHVPAMIPTVELALSQAGFKLSDVDSIAVTQGPGLITSLMVGVDTAKALGAVLNKPVIPVNHLEAHIYANFVGRKINFPAVALIVSGGHTLLVRMNGHGSLKIVGETLDDAAGEAFDKTAKLLGLGYPGGPVLSKLASDGNAARFPFPRPMINSNDLNFSFSGLKTAALYEILKHKTINQQLRADICASVQKAIVDVLIAKTQKAIAKYRPKIIMLGGGVSANDVLRQEFARLAKANKIRASIPEFEYCTDNAAMIGLAAHYKTKQTKNRQFFADPNLEL